MKAKNLYRLVCAEGSHSMGPGRISSYPEPAEQGRQREIIIIQKPAPAANNTAHIIKTGNQSPN